MATTVNTSETGDIITIHKAMRSWPWRLAAVVSLSAVIYIYGRTFGWWWGHWMAEESYYSHGVLIPLMSLFIVYINRQILAKIQLQPSMWGLLFILPAMIIEILARAGNTASIMGMTFPVLLIGMSLLLFGKEMTKRLAFPICFLFFMCVLPGFVLTKLSFRIQMWSTTVAAQMLNLMQFHAVQNGAQISLSNVDVLVGAPCSGFRMLISLFAFASFFAYMKEGPLWGRLTLVGSTAPLSLISNSLRVALIAVVGEFLGTEAMHTFHDYSGFIVLAVSFVFLWWFAKVVKCQKFRSML